MPRLEDYLDGVRGGDPGTPTGARGFGTRCPPCPVCEPQRYYVQRTEQAAPMRGEMRVQSEQRAEQAAPMRSETRVQSEQRAEQAAPVRSALRVQSRALGVTPLALRPGLIPPLPVVANMVLPIYSVADRAQVDSEMWALDSKWLASGRWNDMRMCVRPLEAFGPAVATPVRDLPPAGCRNGITNAPVNMTCAWGFWTIDKCDVETASSLIFQFPRYLWAQSRMRDLLTSVPRPGVTPPQQAADWLWLAAQYISALFWSTNVRFDNPNPQGPSSFVAGMLANVPPPAYDGPSTGKPVVSVVYGGAPVRVMNNLGYRLFAPTRQSDFFPGAGPLPWMDRTAVATRAEYGIPTAGGISPYTSLIPLGVSPEQIEQVRQAAFRYSSATGDADAMRWASTRAFNDFWFAATWNWETKWRVLTDVYRNVHHISAGPGGGSSSDSWSAPQSLAIGGAQVLVDQMVAQLRHYSSADLNYLAWMNQAMLAYTNETSGLPGGGATLDFVNARNALQGQISRASSAAAAASLAAGGTGTAGVVTATVISLFQSIISLVASTVPAMGGLVAIMQQVASLIVQLIGGAVGNTPCPAFPFIRVMAPTGGCDLSQEQIVSSLLGITSNARWPVTIGGQTRTFRIDGATFTVTFMSTDTTADAVARRINAAAALALPPSHPTVAVVTTAGQVAVQATDPGSGPARAVGGNAAALGFPGPLTGTPTTTVPPPLVAPSPPTVAPSGGGAVPLAVGALLALKLLLG